MEFVVLLVHVAESFIELASPRNVMQCVVIESLCDRDAINANQLESALRRERA